MVAYYIPPRKALVEAGWLRVDEKPFLKRLSYPLNERSPYLSPEVIGLRNKILSDIVSGVARPVSIPCCLESENDTLLSEVDRLGLPCRTVINLNSGLIRSDPYYDKKYLKKFYKNLYRDLYQIEENYLSGYISRSVAKGEYILKMVKPFLPEKAKILDVGCGAGATLVPFKMRGFPAFGCDYGEEYLEYGKHLGLELYSGGFVNAKKSAPFDLIILSHVVEHVVELIEFLEQLKTICHNDTLIYVECPGLYNIGRSYKGNFLFYLQNAHVWHFTEDTLKAVLDKVGFEVKHITKGISCLSVISQKTCKEDRNFSNSTLSKEIIQFLAKSEARQKVRSIKMSIFESIGIGTRR